MDLYNCLHTNTDHESLGIKLELYCYTGRETKPRRVTFVDNKTPTPKPKRNDLCLSKNEVPYSEVKDINFKSAKKLKTELDDRIGDLCQSFTSQKVKPTVKPVVEAPIPSQAEMKALFSEDNKSSKKPVILSLVPEFSEQFVLKNRRIPTLPDL